MNISQHCIVGGLNGYNDFHYFYTSSGSLSLQSNVNAYCTKLQDMSVLFSDNPNLSFQVFNESLRSVPSVTIYLKYWISSSMSGQTYAPLTLQGYTSGSVRVLSSPVYNITINSVDNFVDSLFWTQPSSPSMLSLSLDNSLSPDVIDNEEAVG